MIIAITDEEANEIYCALSVARGEAYKNGLCFGTGKPHPLYYEGSQKTVKMIDGILKQLQPARDRLFPRG